MESVSHGFGYVPFNFNLMKKLYRYHTMLFRHPSPKTYPRFHVLPSRGGVYSIFDLCPYDFPKRVTPVRVSKSIIFFRIRSYGRNSSVRITECSRTSYYLFTLYNRLFIRTTCLQTPP